MRRGHLAFLKRTGNDTRLESAWCGPLPTFHIVNSHVIHAGIYRKRFAMLNRHCKYFKIPPNRVCPVCKRFRMEELAWALRPGYLSVCKRCFRLGYAASTKPQLEVIIAERGQPEKNPRRQRIARKYRRLIRLCGNPPQCPHCGNAVPIQEKNVPGKRWIVVEGYLPACRQCWTAGAKVLESGPIAY